MASVTSTDLVIYGSNAMAENDSDTQGGAIDTAVKIVFTDIVPSASILKVSSSASGDNSQTLTITGRDSSGTIITDALSLNGTSTVVGTKSFERILKMVTTSHTGTLTIIDSEGSPNTVATMEPMFLGVQTEIIMKKFF